VEVVTAETDVYPIDWADGVKVELIVHSGLEPQSVSFASGESLELSGRQFALRINGELLGLFNFSPNGDAFRPAEGVGKVVFASGTHQIGGDILVDDLRVESFALLKTQAELSRDRINDALDKYPPPPLRPPPDHPRVLVRPSDVERIRGNSLRPENGTVLARVKALSDLRNDSLVDGVGVIESSSYDKTPFRAMRAKAFQYLILGDEDSGQEAVDLAGRIFEKIEFRHGSGVQRPIGNTIYSGALVYDWCFPLMDDAQRHGFIEHFKILAKKLEVGYPPYGQRAITGHGGEEQILRDLLSAAIAVYDEDPALYRMTAGRFFAEFIEPRNFFYQSGRHHQGNSYFNLRFGSEMFAAWLFRRMSGEDVFFSTQGDLPYIMIYQRRPDGKLLLDGDGPGPSLSSGDYWSYQYPLFLAANYYEDPVLEFELELQGVEGIKWSQPVLYLLLDDPDLQAKSWSDLPLTRFRGGPLASMQCRTSWALGSSSNAVVADLIGAGYQFNNHDHLDAGSFQIYYKGILAHDPGVYGAGSYGNDYDWSFNKRSIAHNTLLVFDPDESFRLGANDGGQRMPNGGREPTTMEELMALGYRNGAVVGHSFGPNPARPFYSYMKVDLAEAYSEKVEAFSRTFCFLNLDDEEHPAALIVVDHVTSSDPGFTKHWLIHSVEKPEIRADVIDIRRTEGFYDGRLNVSVLRPEKVRIEVSGGEDGSVEVFDESFELPVRNREAPGWRTHVVAAEPRKTDLFLNVLQMLPADGGVEPLEVTEWSGEGWIGVGVSNRMVIFPGGDGILDGKIRIGLEKESQVLFTGLARGDWALGGGNFSAPRSARVRRDEGTLFARLEPGDWVLRRGKGAESLPSFDHLEPSESSRGWRELRANIDGSLLELEGLVHGSDGTRLFPISPFLDAVGAEYGVTGDRLDVSVDDRELSLVAGESRYSADGLQKDLPHPPKFQDGEVFVSLESLGQLLRYRVKDSAALGEVILFRPRDPGIWIERTHVEGVLSTNPPQYALDGDPVSYWAAQSEEVFFEMDMGQKTVVSSVEISWFRGGSRRASFQIETSIDGETWETVHDGLSSGLTSKLEAYSFEPVLCRYVRLVCRGNSSSDWNSIHRIVLR